MEKKSATSFCGCYGLDIFFCMGKMESMAGENGVLAVGRFSGERLETHGVPPGWQRNNLGNNSKIAVVGEKEDYFLHLLCVNDYIPLGKKISFDIHIFPSPVNTRSVGYIWDSQAPVGLSGTSTAYRKMKYVVLQSGPVKLNQWICEARNVYDDYLKLFQEEPPAVGGGMLYINTQHSKGSAEISYADIFFSSSLLESPCTNAEANDLEGTILGFPWSGFIDSLELWNLD